MCSSSRTYLILLTGFRYRHVPEVSPWAQEPEVKRRYVFEFPDISRIQLLLTGLPQVSPHAASPAQSIYRPPRSPLTSRPPPNIKKVIYPPHPTDASDLYDEILEHNPELETMLVGQPRMYQPQVAVLTFYASDQIPHRIQAFGKSLEVVEHKERAAAWSRSGSVAPSEAGSPTAEDRGNTWGGVNQGRGRGSWRARGNSGGRGAGMASGNWRRPEV